MKNWPRGFLTVLQARRDLFREYKHIFANLPGDLRMIKLCSDAGFMKTVVRGQYFVTTYEAELAELDCPGSCREYTSPRDDELSKAKGWIRGSTKIGPVLEVTVSYHQGRYGIEIRINSLVGDGSQSWVMICNGLNKYVTEMSEEMNENRDDESGTCAVRLAAKAGPKPTSLREWVDVEPGEYDQHSFEVSKKMTRLLRHDPSVLREEDGAVEFKILAPMFASQFESSALVKSNTAYLQRGGGPKKSFQCCVDPSSAETLYLRATQGHSGGNEIDPALQDNVLLPSDFAEYIYHLGSSHDMHSIIQSGLIPGGKDVKKGSHRVFFTAVNPIPIHLHSQSDYDVTKPRIAVYKQNWKIHQNTVYWSNSRVAQKKGLTSYQTRSDAIILHNTLPALCIEKVKVMNSGKEFFQHSL